MPITYDYSSGAITRDFHLIDRRDACNSNLCFNCQHNDRKAIDGFVQCTNPGITQDSKSARATIDRLMEQCKTEAFNALCY